MNRRHVLGAAVALLVGVTVVYGAIAVPTDGVDAVNDPTGTVDEPTATPSPTLEPPGFDAAGELSLNATDGQEISGTTALEEGTTIAVRLRSAGEHPFIQSREVTVDADGRFVATFDLCVVALDEPTAVEATVVHDGEHIANASGQVHPVATSDCGTTSDRDDTARFLHDGDRITLQSADGQVVRAATGLPAGTTVSVRLKSTDGDQPFIKSREVTVDEDGQVAATFDLSDSTNQSVEAQLVHEGAVLASADGRVTD